MPGSALLEEIGCVVAHKYQKKTLADGSTVFRYQYVDPTTRKRRSLTAPSVAELEIARRHLAEGRAAISAGIEPSAIGVVLPGRVDPRRATVGAIWEHYLSCQGPQARSKAESYGRRNLNLPLRRFDGSTAMLFDLPICELSVSTMKSWLSSARATGGRRGTGRAWKTIKTAYDLLASAARSALPEDAPLPWGRWRPQRGTTEQVEPVAVASWDEARALVAAAAAEDAPKQQRGRYADAAARCLFGIATGLRNAEIAGLGWDDFTDLDGPAVVLHVRHQAQKNWRRWFPGPRPLSPPKGKAGRARTRRQILEPVAVVVLRQLRDEQRRRGWWRSDGPVFGVERDGGWHWRTTGYAIDPTHVKRWAKAAGISEPERWCTHSLRHSLGTLVGAATGGDARAVQQRLGHADLKTTLHYWHRLGKGLAPPAMGHELQAPQVALLTRGEARDRAVGTPLPELDEDAGDPWGITTPPPSVTAVHDAAIGAARQRQRAEKRARDAAPPEPWARLADRWLVAPERSRSGRPLPRPAEVTRTARKAAVAAWQRAKQEGIDARGAWRKSFRAALARWARELNDARRRAAAAAE